MGSQIEYFRKNVLPKYEKIVENMLKMEQLELCKKQIRLDNGKACVMWHKEKGKLKKPKNNLFFSLF